MTSIMDIWIWVVCGYVMYVLFMLIYGSFTNDKEILSIDGLYIGHVQHHYYRKNINKQRYRRWTMVYLFNIPIFAGIWYLSKEDVL